MQANSPPERFTPSSRTVAPVAVTSLLPETWIAGAGASAGGVGGGLVGGVTGGLVGGVAGGLAGGGGVEGPLGQAPPVRVKAAGTGLLPDQVPMKPTGTDAPVPSEPFQPALTAV